MTTPPSQSPTRTSTAERVSTQFDWATVRPSTAIVRTVAIALDVNPLEIDPLYNSINPKAVDAVIGVQQAARSQRAVELSFPFAGTIVTAHRDGRVEVVPGDDTVADLG